MNYNQLVMYPEWIHHGQNSYLSIPKNACTTVKHALYNYYKNNNLDTNPLKCTYQYPNTNVSWAVIREPFERLISGLAYDIKRNNVDEKVILKNFENSLYGTMSPTFRSIANETHTYSQLCYLIGNPSIDVYVDIEDLDLFLKMNFDYAKSETEITNKVEMEYKNKALEIIEIFGEQRVKDKLSFDTYIYNTIKNSADLWKWQNGKIFT